MKVRTATSADSHVLVELNMPVHQMHVAAHPEIFKPLSDQDAELLAYYEEMLTDSNIFIYLAEVEQRPVGYIVARIQHRPETVFTHSFTRMYIDQISVDENHQGQGCGSLLMQAVLALAKEKDITHVALDVWRFNAHAQKFFIRQGFNTDHARMVYTLNHDKD